MPSEEVLAAGYGRHLNVGDPGAGKPRECLCDEPGADAAATMISVHGKVIEPGEVDPVGPDGQRANGVPIQPASRDGMGVRQSPLVLGAED